MERLIEVLVQDAEFGAFDRENFVAALLRCEAEKERAIRAIFSGDFEIVVFDD